MNGPNKKKTDQRGPLGDLMERARGSEGITQKELAERLGVSEKTVKNWEEGHGLPKPSNVRKLAEGLALDRKEVAATVQKQKAQKAEIGPDPPAQTSELPKPNWKWLRLLVAGGVLVVIVLIVLIVVIVVRAPRTIRKIERRRLALMAEEVLKGKTWIAYDPTTFKPSIEGNEAIFPTVGEIRADLQTLKEYGFTGIITFASDRPPLTKIPEYAEDFGMAVIMGAHVSDDMELTDRQISNAINEQDHVVAYCIGHNPKIDLSRLKSLLAEVRAKTGRPVTTTFPLITYRSETRVREMSDFLFPDIRPNYRDSAVVEHAVAEVRASIDQLVELQPSVPVVVKMVSFPSDEKNENNTYPPSSDGELGMQARFFIRVLRDIDTPPRFYWSYFGAYDTPWKADYPKYWAQEDTSTGLFRTPSREPKRAAMVFKEQLQIRDRKK